MTEDWRIGQGWDLHRLVADRPLILGGVEIPFTKGLAGHSDADALTHAVIDALLGAIGGGDIGTLFPDSDRAWRGAVSLDLLRQVVQRMHHAGWALVNLDATVVAQAPRIGPHRERMQAALADPLGVEPSAISIKAKTAEGLGPEGRGEAISAQVVVLLRRLAG